MANPLDREIGKVLRKGQKPEAWKRPGANRDGGGSNQGSPGGSGPVGQGGKPPTGSGMNKPTPR